MKLSHLILFNALFSTLSPAATTASKEDEEACRLLAEPEQEETLVLCKQQGKKEAECKKAGEQAYKTEWEDCLKSSLANQPTAQ